MTEALATLRKYKKADKLLRVAFRKNGPKSYKRGQGALIITLLDMGGEATQKDLVNKMCASRAALKDLVRKAERNGYVEIKDHEDAGTYVVALTEDGKAVAEKRAAKQAAYAEEVLSVLSAEEIDQLNAINEKLIVSLKEKGINAKKKGYKHTKRCKHHKHHKHHC